ncbi:hypothetical protein COCSUDRAFT_61510 [Coccomyxa subellipsoidea C-169]|uniref:Uncharacterized protein n=1 Tax=Coccomyxa subellipsoidea (strain C-169) TaxID=574566 RepID=I0Z3R6_COCSC|nr:hypothetical protein COCSUDRAFT_61510 [Coccomyxa subellipsoidea C-169]EIE25285.1 hypothetical protein COCSUDRAFT_61510 [Coccomyxa subellipsoidea C-169]|eukprot:XP_005649829.1 hypothetical protein COCSUDRAFT_61510 [Coccomyxa subellipsoidea C-169]
MAGRIESSGRASLADPVEHLAARGGLPNRELMCRPQPTKRLAADSCAQWLQYQPAIQPPC